MTDIRTISAQTQFCMVIGNPIAHSLSPAIHNAAYAHRALDFVYVAAQVQDVAAALAGMRTMDQFRGMSITIPHKVNALRHVDRVTDVDRAIGAINTVVHDANELVGINTDGPGALKAITDAGVALAGSSVLMLGAGGAARAIAFSLAWDNQLSELCVLDIDNTICTQLAKALRSATDTPVRHAVFDNAALAGAMARADLIIHCTPVGMHPESDRSLVPPELFRKGQVVFDIVYTPLATKLLTDAQACGLQTISGVDMFVNQAVLQFERFTETTAPVEIMRSVVFAHLKS